MFDDPTAGRPAGEPAGESAGDVADADADAGVDAGAGAGAPAARFAGRVTVLVEAARSAVDAVVAVPDDELGRVPTGELLAAVGVLESLGTTVSLAQARLTAAVPVVEPVVRSVTDPDTGVRTVGSFLPAGAVSPQELSAALAAPVELARARFADATALRGLPGVTAAARDGQLRWWQLRRVADAVVGLDPAARAAVDARIAADAAAGRCRSRFTARLRRAVCATEPDRADADHQRSFEQRRTSVRPDGAGMAWFGALLTAQDALTVGECLDVLAPTAPPPHPPAPCGPQPPAGPEPDGRTADQRRADALVAICRDALDRHHGRTGTTDRSAGPADAADPDSGAGPVGGPAGGAAGTPGTPGRRRRGRRRGEVQVVVSAETLLGIAEDPGELLGHGPIGAGQARRIAHLAGMTWRRILTDPSTGAVLEVGRETHTPPERLAAHVLATFGWQCTRPGCAHRPHDLDHATARLAGGATDPANLHGVCRGCHTAKHSGWTVDLDSDAGARWTSPHGLVATTPPADLRPEDRHPPPARIAAGPPLPHWLAALRRQMSQEGPGRWDPGDRPGSDDVPQAPTDPGPPPF